MTYELKIYVHCLFQVFSGGVTKLSSSSAKSDKIKGGLQIQIWTLLVDPDLLTRNNADPDPASKSQTDMKAPTLICKSDKFLRFILSHFA